MNSINEIEFTRAFNRIKEYLEVITSEPVQGHWCDIMDRKNDVESEVNYCRSLMIRLNNKDTSSFKEADNFFQQTIGGIVNALSNNLEEYERRYNDGHDCYDETIEYLKEMIFKLKNGTINRDLLIEALTAID